jgi:hypothetical protein
VRVVRHLQQRVLEVRQAEHGLTRPRAQASLADLLGAEDPRFEHMLGMQAIATHWAELPAREQQIVVLRYYRGMTQAQIGQQLGISQMQVCRLLARALSYLGPRLFGQPEYVPGTVPPFIGTAGAAPRSRRTDRYRLPLENDPAPSEPDDLRARAGC